MTKEELNKLVQNWVDENQSFVIEFGGDWMIMADEIHNLIDEIWEKM